ARVYVAKPRPFLTRMSNLFDTLIVAGTLADSIFVLTADGGTSIGAVRLVRLLRLVRAVKTTNRIRSFRVVIDAFASSGPLLLNVSFILLFFV
uniref:ion transporter n=1 Tax=Vibrio cholerae TaxID=666 RepID=UPI0018F0A3D7